MYRFHFKVMLLLLLSAALVFPAHAAHEKSAQERIETLSSRIENLEKQLAEKPAGLDWIENVVISGLLEAEAGYEKHEPAAAGESDEESSDIVLATMELGIDTDFNDYISGHVLFLWEEDETEPVDVDEGFMTLSGGNACPGYVRAGKFYVPFGNFESIFISDPLTLELGETNESAVLAGYAAGPFDVSAGVFNGDIAEAGKDDHIDDYFGSATYSFNENAFGGIAASAGVSYISNIGDSDGLSDALSEDIPEDETTEIADKVAGMSAYLHATLAERVFFVAEYVGALDDFAAGELEPAAPSLQPRTWNTELAYVFESECGFGVKYEGADDVADALAETRYGAVAFCHPFPGTFLGLECLRETYEKEDDNTVVTAQLAYEF